METSQGTPGPVWSAQVAVQYNRQSDTTGSRSVEIYKLLPGQYTALKSLSAYFKQK
jgi:hypothetical protein